VARVFGGGKVTIPRRLMGWMGGRKGFWFSWFRFLFCCC